ncbi:MAG: ATP-binding cassette domain-containing protein, partial [Cyanobacteria bacterium J069]
MLNVENLTKSYPRSGFALQDLSFAVAPHTFTAILGPSGAGKTTLLRCLLQLIRPDQGQVWFQGRNLTTCPASQLRQSRRQIAIVAQQFNLVRRRTALENCLGGRLSELPLWRCFANQFPPQLLREGLAALERVQLLEVAFQRADQLSGGQQQRVAIARALTQ